MVSAERCEHAPPREVDGRTGGPIVLAAMPIQNRICRFYGDDRVLLQPGFNEALQLARILGDMKRFHMLKSETLGFEVDWPSRLALRGPSLGRRGGADPVMTNGLRLQGADCSLLGESGGSFAELTFGNNRPGLREHLAAEAAAKTRSSQVAALGECAAPE
ncbi:MAG TPA: hypothetical protein VH109_03325 [Steroidobacteraceae bacterium]|nr:hypothetical protein [Steroidobacteraceae bacterium]